MAGALRLSTPDWPTLEHQVLDRLLHFQPSHVPVLSVYLTIPLDPGELRDVKTRLHSLLKPVRALADSDELGHDQRASLHSDLARVLDMGSRIALAQGRSVAAFACNRHDFYEEVALPRSVRDRATVDARPYLRPLLAVMDEAHRYCVVVVSRKRAWLYEYYMGEIREATNIAGAGVRKRDYAGWYGLDEHRVRNRADQLIRQQFRETAAAVDELMRRSGAELLVVGGNDENVAKFLPFLSRPLQSRVVGTFTIDPHTMTPASIREFAAQAAVAHERAKETELVAKALEQALAGGLGASGLEWCLTAVNEKAVQLLLVQDDEQAPGRVSDKCGWLGQQQDPCPVCGEPTRPTVDLINDMAIAVIESGGNVEHVYAATALSHHLVIALLRFPVPQPTG